MWSIEELRDFIQSASQTLTKIEMHPVDIKIFIKETLPAPTPVMTLAGVAFRENMFLPEGIAVLRHADGSIKVVKLYE